MTVDPTSTATTFVFDVTYTKTQPVLGLGAPTNVLPSTSYAAALTTAWNNADLLPYFNPFLGDSVGYISTFASAVTAIYQYGSGANENVDSAIDQVLYAAQYTPPADTPSASQEQLGRLRNVLETVAGDLRGEAAGILLTQYDANPEDSQNATFSDSAVSTQRSGQDQRYYIVVPADVQGGSFQIRFYFDGEATRYTTGVINMPSTVGNEPGGPIDAATTAQNIASAINAILGNVWPYGGVPFSGSVNVRIVPQTEIDQRNGSAYAIPDGVILAETPTARLVAGQVRSPTVVPGGDTSSAYVFELTFQGQAHDTWLPSMTIINSNTTQWVETVTTTTAGVGFTWTQAGATGVKVFAGDYQGTTGPVSYGASLAMTSSGSFVDAYTYEPQDFGEINALSTSTSVTGASAASSLNGLTQANVYVQQLAESTATAGPRIVRVTDSNGIDLLNPPGGTATSVNSRYFVLTFDEPMLSISPAIDADSIYNTNSYQIYDSAGNLIAGAVAQIHYGLNEVAAMAQTYGASFTANPDALIPDNKWEAVLTLSDNGVPLPSGTYTLTVLNAIPPTTSGAGQTGLRHIHGTPLNETGFNPVGADFTQLITFNTSATQGQAPLPPGLTQTDTPINATRGGQQIDPAVATSASGNYVIVWTSDIKGQTNIFGQLYNAEGLKIGTQFTVNTTASTTWGTPAVAMDALGDFVVVWSSAGPNSNAQTSFSDIFARIYNLSGQAIGNQFQVDQFALGVQTPGLQNQPRVAMGPDGTFVVTWTSTPISVSNTNTANSAIFAREYNKLGAPLSSEFQVTASTTVANTYSDVAMDSRDDFVVTWEGDLQSSTWGVYGKYFTVSSATAAIIGATEVGTTVTITTATAGGFSVGNTVVISGVATPGYNGTFTITSVSGNTFTYNNVTTGLGASGGGTAALPLHWNATGQMLLTNAPNSRGSFASGSADLYNRGPRVAMFPTTAGASAPFVVTWASYLSSNSNFDIFAETFNSNGSARTAAFQVNEPPAQLQPNLSPPTIGWQLMPDVSVDSMGHISIVWTSFGQDNAEVGNPSILDYGIYMRMYNEDGSNYFDPTLGFYPLEFRVNATTLGNQVAPAVASDNPSDNSIVAWVGPDTLAAATTAIYERVIDPPAAGPAKAPLPPAGAPVVTTNPASQSVAAGASVTFTAAATGTPKPAVQWQVSSNNGSTFSKIAGATSTSYTLTAAASQSGYEYRAVFSNSLSTVDSTAATLKVSAPLVNPYNVPAVTINPASQGVNAGTTVIFTAAASGSPTPTVQWQSSTNGLTWANIAAATKTSYSLTATAGLSGSMYRAVFTNSVGTATTSSAVLTVYMPPAITTNPVSKSVAVNAQVVFTAAASGSPAPSVQWQSSANGTTWANIAGATSTSFPVVATAAASGMQYRAVFTNRLGTATTTAAKLTVSVPPVVTVNPLSKTVTAGLSATFMVAATGTPAPTVQWQTSANGTTWTNISGATSTVYSVKTTGAMTGSQYRAVFSNAAGTVATTAAALTVNSAPVVLSSPVAQSVAAGASVTFTASASGSPAPAVQWQVSTNNGGTWANIAGATATTYKFTAATSQSGCEYRALFTNSVGLAVTPAARLTVKAAAKMASASAAAVAAAVTNLDNANSLSTKNSLYAAAIDAVLARRL